ncbi:MAG: DUF6363 domain-containing protein [Anaeromassilibacillus sp.]
MNDGNPQCGGVDARRLLPERDPVQSPHSASKIYGKYPSFIEAVQRRPLVYNSELDLCTQQEQAGKAVLIRPSKPIPVGRYEKNPERLKQAYEMGRKDAEQKLPEVRALLAQG